MSPALCSSQETLFSTFSLSDPFFSPEPPSACGFPTISLFRVSVLLGLRALLASRSGLQLPVAGSLQTSFCLTRGCPALPAPRVTCLPPRQSLARRRRHFSNASPNTKYTEAGSCLPASQSVGCSLSSTARPRYQESSLAGWLARAAAYLAHAHRVF